MAQPGPWRIGATAFGEMLPNHANRISLDTAQTDKWGLPVLAIDCATGENERLMRRDMMNDMAEMLEAAGVKDVSVYDNGYFARHGHPRDGHGAHGPRPEDVGAERPNQVWDCHERVRHRRRVHDLVGLPEPVADLHGADGARGGLRRRGVEARQSVSARSATDREAMQRDVDAFCSAAPRWSVASAILAALPSSAAARAATAAQGAGTFTAADVAFLDEIADTILPETSTPGAKAAQHRRLHGADGDRRLHAAQPADLSRRHASGSTRRVNANMAWRSSQARPDAATGIAAAARSPNDRPNGRAHATRRSRAPVAPSPPPDAPVHYFRLMKELALLGYFTSEIGYRRPCATWRRRDATIPARRTSPARNLGLSRLSYSGLAGRSVRLQPDLC